MSDRPHSASETPPPASSAERLTRELPQVMRLWEERVRAARASTPDAAAPTLTELLPAVLQDVVEALQRVGRLPRRTTPGAADERAGGSQAFAAGATLEHVLEEYGLLRTTLFSFLEAEEPLPPAERDAVYQVLEVATQRASRWFSTAHQETLHGREALHRLLVENARDYAMLTADRDNRVTSWNTGAERLMGYREEEILGQSASIIFVPEDRAKGDDLKELAKALDTGEAVNERWHLRKDGSRFWGSGIMHALYDPAGQFVGFGKVMRDRTAEMLVEQERSHYLERLRMLADITSDLLFQNQPSRFIEHVYARLARSLDLEVYVNYLVNDSGNALRLAAYAGLPEHVAEEIRHLSFGMAVCGAVAQRRERVVAENIQQSTDPRTALVRSVGVRAYTCHPLIAGEELIGTLSFGTTRRDTFAPDELELIRSVCEQVAVALERARLMQTLQDRAAALTDADQRKDEFLAMLAHELRNPLAGIVNAVHVLNAIDEQVSPRQRLRDIVGRQASNLTRMVDDLLDVSRITQRKIELRRETIDVVAVAHQAAEAIRPLVESRGHELTFEPPREALCVEADRTRLEQVVSNLLNNAAKYTPPGGRIWLSVRAKGDMAVLQVRDTGVGMPPELLPRVFDLFTQANRTPERAEGGLGIGLTLVRRLVELHGGTVEASSAGPGQGSTFTVRLPLATGDAAPAEFPVAIPGKVPSRYRILVVEDNVDAAETLAELLQLWDHQVQMAHTGTAGLDAVRTFQPDVVLLDIGLAGMNGLEVARHIRADGSLPQPLLVALTGYGQESDRQLAREAGFDHHLTKPVDPVVLQQVLASHRP